MTQSKENALTDSEIEKLLNACVTPEDKFIVITLIYSGMRVSEFTHMKKDWIDWQDETINIPAQSGDWKPKTKTAVRSIPISHEIRLREALRSYFAMHDHVKWTRVAVWMRIKKLAGKAGIPHKVHPHSLRATAATLFAHAGLSAPAVQYILGWSQLMTAEHYVQSSKKRAMEEVKRVYSHDNRL